MAQDQKLHKLDDLFRDAKQYTKSSEYLNLIKFCQRMRHLGPYNAMLASMQMPGARFLLNADRWADMGRVIKITARPVIILLPFGPVDFLFDLSDTFPMEHAMFASSEDEILEHIKHQFDPMLRYDIHSLMNNLYYNLQLEGICIERNDMGTQQAGMIIPVSGPQQYKVDVLIDSRSQIYESSQALFLIDVSKKLGQMGELLTVLHELGHLYCHHLPHPHPSDADSWAMRSASKNIREFEAESVAAIVFDHFGIEAGGVAIEYLAHYASQYENIPKGVSPDYVFAAAGKIIQMMENKLSVKEGLLYKCNESFRHKVDRVKKAKTKKVDKKTDVSQDTSLF